MEGAFSLETVAKKRPRGAFYFFEMFVFSHFLHNFQTMFWRQYFWSQGPTQECSKDSQGQSQDGPSGPKMRVCACRSAHQWIGRTHIRAHRPETDLPKTTQEQKGPSRTAPKRLQGSPRTTRTTSRTKPYDPYRGAGGTGRKPLRSAAPRACPSGLVCKFAFQKCLYLRYLHDLKVCH